MAALLAWLLALLILAGPNDAVDCHAARAKLARLRMELIKAEREAVDACGAAHACP